MTQSAPVPAQAIHFKNPRRSMPSLLWSCSMKPLAFEFNRFLFDTVGSSTQDIVGHLLWIQATRTFAGSGSNWLAPPVRTCYNCLNRSRPTFIPFVIYFER